MIVKYRDERTDRGVELGGHPALTDERAHISASAVLLIIAAVAAVAAAALCEARGLRYAARLRWLALAALIAYGCLRRTLTAWIFIAMLLGAEIGHDFPERRHSPARAGADFPAPDQDHHCAAAVCDAGGRHRRALQPEAGRAPGPALHHLLRGHYHRSRSSWGSAPST